MTLERNLDSRRVDQEHPVGLYESFGSDSECSKSRQIPNRNDSRWDALAGLSATECDRITKRFWSKASRVNSCLIWQAAKNRQGYGCFNVPRPNGKQKFVLAHRMASRLAFGPFDPDLDVCHHCDTPACVEPSHLFLGTQQDNASDAVSKGRMDRKLTYADRLAIYWSAEPNVVLARRFGISSGCVSLTKRGRFAGCPGLVRVPSRELVVLGEVA